MFGDLLAHRHRYSINTRETHALYYKLIAYGSYLTYILLK